MKKRILAFNKKHNTFIPVVFLLVIIFILGFNKIGTFKILLIVTIISVIYFIYEFGDGIMKKIKRKKSDTKEINLTKKDIVQINETKKNKTTNKKKKTKKKSKLNTILFILLIFMGIGLLLLACGAAYIVIRAPKFDIDRLYTKEKSVIYDSENNVIAELGTEKRDKVTYDELPEVLIDAIIATEDSNFFNHNGVDLGRFTVATVKQLLGKSGGGASTISMQVVKNQFTSTEQTLTRKFTDIYLSVFKLEKQYTKEQILEFYVNIPYLGNGSYGVKQAAMSYFGKDISDLTLPEAAMIAGMFQAPNTYDPTKNPENTKERRSTVLSLMQRHGYITKEEREAAENVLIEDMIKTGTTVQTKYQGYVDVVVSEIEEKTGESPYNTSMEIYTALVPKKQEYIERVLKGEIYQFKNNVIQTGISVVDVNTGAIVAIGSGRNKEGAKTYNFATMTKRQIGSTAKPVFDYGPAIEYNDWYETKTIVDGPYKYSDGTPIRNVDNSYKGTLTVRDALTMSRNIPALKTFQQVDNSKIKEFVTNLGITPEIDDSGRLHEAHSIGAFNGASPLQMSAAYAAFANGGYYIKPYTVTKVIYNQTGEEENFSPTKKRAMSDSTAFLIADMLKYGIQSGNIDVMKLDGINFGAKTGTTNFDDETIKRYGLSNKALNDLWTVGFDQQYSIAMWLGYEKIDSRYYNTTANWTDRKQLFHAISKGIFEQTGKDFVAPSSVVKIGYRYGSNGKICLASEGDTDAIYDWFKVGTEPTNTCSDGNTKIPDVSGLAIKSAGNGSLTLSWNSPTMAETYGLPTYIIYKDDNGTLTEIGNTDSNSYKVSVTEDKKYIFIVKVKYSNSSGLSSGSSVSIDLSNNTNNDNTTENKVILLDLKGGSTVRLNQNESWTDPGLYITENGIDVTNKYPFTKTIKFNGTTVNSVDTSKEGTYTITYTVQINGENKSISRKVTIIATSTPSPTPTTPPVNSGEGEEIPAE